MKDFKFTVYDINRRNVISINCELIGIRKDIKINYNLLNYGNSYMVTQNTNGSAITTSTGYRYT